MSASCGIDAERCKAARLRRAAEGNQERIEVRDLHIDTASNGPLFDQFLLTAMPGR